MEQLMKNMETLNGQIKTEMQNYKKKCEDQETMITSMKKCLHMDKLEIYFESYKQDMKTKIKSLEDDKIRMTVRIKSLEDEKSSLQRKYNNTHKELTSTTSSLLNLKKKVDGLTKQLEAEKALRKKAECFSLENKIALDKIVPKAAVSQTISVKLVPITLTSQTSDKVELNNQINGKPVIPHSTTAVSNSKSTTVTNGVTENNPLVKPSLAADPLTMFEGLAVGRSRRTRKRKMVDY